jgi:hypothetical protein
MSGCRRVSSILAVWVLVGLPAAALAQGEVNARYGESPRTSAFEIKLGTFNPNPDREAGVTGTPFADTFGRNGMLLAELEYDRQLFQAFGSAAVGFSLGYTEIYGYAVVSGSTTLAADKTGLILLPLKILGVYRFDYFALKNRFPLVPFGKVALIYTPWWSVKGGKVETVNGLRAAGGKWGYGLVAGLSFLLDVLEPRMARDFDSDIGVNHVYLFAEYAYQGSIGTGLNLSSSHFMFGLNFEL